MKKNPPSEKPSCYNCGYFKGCKIRSLIFNQDRDFSTTRTDLGDDCDKHAKSILKEFNNKYEKTYYKPHWVSTGCAMIMNERDFQDILSWDAKHKDDKQNKRNLRKSNKANRGPKKYGERE